MNYLDVYMENRNNFYYLTFLFIKKCMEEEPNAYGLWGYIRKIYINRNKSSLQKGTENLINQKWGEMEKWLENNKPKP